MFLRLTVLSSLLTTQTAALELDLSNDSTDSSIPEPLFKVTLPVTVEASFFFWILI